jgi:hypothetical protein
MHILVTQRTTYMHTHKIMLSSSMKRQNSIYNIIYARVHTYPRAHIYMSLHTCTYTETSACACICINTRASTSRHLQAVQLRSHYHPLRARLAIWVASDGWLLRYEPALPYHTLLAYIHYHAEANLKKLHSCHVRVLCRMS